MKNVTINDTNYTGVSEVQLSVTGGGTANFRDVDEITTPSGSINITANGTHNVSAYAQAVVNVAAESGGDDATEFAEFMAGKYGKTGLSENKTFNCPDGVTVIRKYAFHGVTPDTGAVATVNLPDTVTEFCDYAFNFASRVCINKLPNGLTAIGGHCFNYARSVFGDSTTLEIPASVGSIAQLAFYQYNGNVNTITFKGTPTSIANNAFQTSAITTINVPWAEGEVANAPWAATSATINYNYTGA